MSENRGFRQINRSRITGEWEPTNRISLNTVKSGEAYKLELHSAELLDLVEALGPLYRSQWEQDGVEFGRRTYVRMEASAARFMRLGQADLENLLNAHPEDAIGILRKLLQWVAARPISAEAASAVASLEPERLPSVAALMGLSALKSAVELWDNNRSNGSERFWQDELQSRSYVLSQLFAQPIVVIQERAYVGGKLLDNRGGSYLDFLTAAAATHSIALIEIKTPKTPLLAPAYRTGAYPPSDEITGAIAQVLKYKRTIRAEFERFRRPRGLIFGEPRCIVIAGDVERQLTHESEKESFEEFRGQLRNVDIIGYDELFARVRGSAALLEQGLEAAG